MSDAFESMRASWRRSYLLFAVFSAFAALFRVPAVPVLWGGRNLIAAGLALAVVVAAVAVLCAPGQPRRLLLLSAMQLAGVVAGSTAGAPWSGGEALTGLVNLTVVVYGVRRLMRRRGRPLDGAALMANLSPVLRVVTAFFYGFSFLWKVRHGVTQPGLINASLVVEGLAPLLLLLPVTRSWGALGMVVFHAVVGSLGLLGLLGLLGSDAEPRQSMGFAATMFALLLPALSPNQLQSPAANRTVKWVLRWLAPVGATVWPPLLFVVIATRDQVTAAHLFTVGRYCAFLVYSLVLVVIFAGVARVPRRINWTTNGSAPA